MSCLECEVEVDEKGVVGVHQGLPLCLGVDHLAPLRKDRLVERPGLGLLSVSFRVTLGSVL